MSFSVFLYHGLWESAAQGGATGACPQLVGDRSASWRRSPKHSDPGFCETKAGIPPKNKNGGFRVELLFGPEIVF